MQINDFLYELNENSSNIEDVYNKFYKKYSPNTTNRTELCFINSFNFDNFHEELHEKAKKLSIFLGKRETHAKWYNMDYYRYFVTYRVFKFPVLFIEGNYQEDSYKKSFYKLKEIYRKYMYIYRKLKNKSDKTELTNHLLDQLKNINKNQHRLKNKYLLEELNKKILKYSKNR